MNDLVIWVLLALGVGIVVVQRRSMAIALLSAQSLVLGVIAVNESLDSRVDLIIAGIGLVARGLVLPVLLALIVRGTREPRRVAGERYMLPRLVLAVFAMGVAAALTPDFGLVHGAEGQAAIALVVLGIVIATVRRPVVFQAIGFLVAENGVYLAGLAVVGGLPGVVEMALVFDLMLVLVVAGAFGTKIHEEFGTSDTTVLGNLRD